MMDDKVVKNQSIDFKILVIIIITFKLVQFFSLSCEKSFYINILLSIIFLFQITYLICLKRYKGLSKDEESRMLNRYFRNILLIESFAFSLCSANLIGNTLKKKVFVYGILSVLLLITLVCSKQFFKKKNAKQTYPSGQDSKNLNPVIQKSVAATVPTGVVIMTLCIRLKIISLEQFFIVFFIFCAFIFILPFATNQR